MANSTMVLVWFLGIPAALAAGVFILWALEWIIWNAGSSAAACQDAFNRWRNSAAHKSDEDADEAEFRAWVEAQTGTASNGGRIDQRLVDAQRQSETIRVLVEEEIPKAVMHCVNAHWQMARVTGAHNFSEIAYEPECYRQRGLVVWILTHTTRVLESYPLLQEDQRLLYNSMVLRKRALLTCSRCPFIRLETATAPRLCPTAQLVHIGGKNAGSIP